MTQCRTSSASCYKIEIKKQKRWNRERREERAFYFYIYFFLVAFSADLVTEDERSSEVVQDVCMKFSVLTLATRLLSLVDGLDDTDSDGLTHVTDGEATKRRVLVVGLNTHWLARDELDNACIAGLDKLGRLLHDLAGTTIDLLDKLGELASNVGSVAIEHWCIASTDLTRVVQDDDLSVERRSLLGRVVLGVGGDVATTNVLDRHVPVRR